MILSYILIILFIVHFGLSIYGTIQIRNAIIYDERKKQINIIMLWVIPFIWFWITQSMLKRTPGSFEISEKREDNSFYESGAGAPYTNIKDR